MRCVIPALCFSFHLAEIAVANLKGDMEAKNLCA